MPKTIIADRPANYKKVMASAPGTVSATMFADALQFAKEKKRKRPSEELLVALAPIKPAGDDAVKAARKEAAEKRAAKKDEPKAERVTNAQKTCFEDDCDQPAYAKGRCSRHYTAHRRQDPAIMEAARKASREYRSRQA